MTKNDVKVGGQYVAVTEKGVKAVEVVAIDVNANSGRKKTTYKTKNLEGRGNFVFPSAAKFRFEIYPVA